MLTRIVRQNALRALASLVVLGSGAAASAQESGGWHDGRWRGQAPASHGRDYPTTPGAYPDQPDPLSPPARRFEHPGREAWLADCRRRLSAQDRGLGGAAIGSVVGGVAGNRLAGRDNRVIGTVAGAAVGAAAGVAIDKAEDQGRNRDTCEAYLHGYYASFSNQQPGAAYAPGYAYGQTAPMFYGQSGCCGAPVVMVPVLMQPAQPECTETVEYIYEDVPVRPRVYRAGSKRRAVVRDKRVEVTSDKRIPSK